MISKEHLFTLAPMLVEILVHVYSALSQHNLNGFDRYGASFLPVTLFTRQQIGLEYLFIVIESMVRSTVSIQIYLADVSAEADLFGRFSDLNRNVCSLVHDHPMLSEIVTIDSKTSDTRIIIQ